MAGKQLQRHMLICDGCGATLGENGEYATPADSRAAAAERGWTVVPMLKTNGKPAQATDASGRLIRGSDVCPACRPTFQPRRIKANPTAGQYVLDLREENRRLREELAKRGVQA